LPKAVRIEVLVNPDNVNTGSMTADISEAARAIGLRAFVLNATTSGEIDAAFETMAREGTDALFVSPDSFYVSRRNEFAILAAHYRIPATFFTREFVEAGGLMSYGTYTSEMFHQAGGYVGRILKGAKPADLPVVQSTKFELAINLHTAELLGITVPPTLLAIADEVIE
jgi:putative tryptophan/tyrosine transport system substrate-binding protein